MQPGLTFSLLSPAAVPPSSSKLRDMCQHTWQNVPFETDELYDSPSISSGFYLQLHLPIPVLHNFKKLNSY